MRAYATRSSGAFGHALLRITLVAGAACGGAGGTGAGPHPASPPSSIAPAETAAVSAAPAGSAEVTPKPSSPGGARAISRSTLASELEGIGLDAGKLPALSRLEPDKLRKVMKTFSKALGVPCTGCHNVNNFRAPTRNKKLASKMWDQYVRGLAFEDGSALYCDSCHQGKTEILDRHDKKALGAWMDANFVTKLRRTDKQDHGCATCHGEEMKMRFLAEWAK